MITHESSHISAGILSLLPLYYVGWSDSVLSPSELKFIHEKIESYDFLTFEDKSYLKNWSDPLNPPSEKQFKQWGVAIKKYSKGLSPDHKKSLIIRLNTFKMRKINNSFLRLKKIFILIQNIEIQ